MTLDNDLLNHWLRTTPTRALMQQLVEEIQELRDAERRERDSFWRDVVESLENQIEEQHTRIYELETKLAAALADECPPNG